MAKSPIDDFEANRTPDRTRFRRAKGKGMRRNAQLIATSNRPFVHREQTQQTHEGGRRNKGDVKDNRARGLSPLARPLVCDRT